MLVNLEGIGRGGDPMSVQDYVDTYCMPGSQKNGSCIPIVHVANFPLQVVVSTIVWVAVYSSLHLSTRTKMRVVVECLQRTVFDWCSGVIPIMKKQLSDCKRGHHNNFGYSSVLVALFFERVSGLRPAIPRPIRSPCQPRMSRWGEIFLHREVVDRFRLYMMMNSTFGGSDSCQPWSSFHMLD